MIKVSSSGARGWAHAPAPWSPSDIADLSAWYRSDDLTTGVITTWSDRSANARHLTSSGSPTVLASALNGEKAARLDGTDDYFYVADAGFRAANGISAYIVLRWPTSLIINEYIIDNYTSASVPGAGLRTRDSSNNLGLRIAGTQANDTNPLSTATWYTLGAVWNQNTTTKIIYDGTERTASLSTTSVNGSGLIVGAYGGTPGGFSEIDVVEMIYTASELSTSNKAGLATYLAGRYAI